MGAFIVTCIFLIVYVLSVIRCRHEIIEEHKKYIIEPDFIDIIVCFIPVYNTFHAIMAFFERKSSVENMFSKFVKKFFERKNK